MEDFSLIDRYIRLLQTDKAACSELFTEDSEFVTPAGERRIRLLGRDQIGDFLALYPPNMKLELLSSRKEGENYYAEIKISGDMTPAFCAVWRYRIRDEKFIYFEIVSLGSTPPN